VTTRPGPITLAELGRLWQARAAALGLAPGDPDDVRLAAFRRLGPRSWGPFRPAEVADILDALEGQARLRRPRYALALVDGRPAIVVDPLGRADNLRAVLADFEEAARRIADEALVAAIEAEHARGQSYGHLAARFGMSERTLHRLRRCQRTADADTGEPAKRGDDCGKLTA